MLNSVQDYETTLYEVNRKSRLEFILIHLSGKTKIVASSKLLNEILPKSLNADALPKLIEKKYSGILQKFSKDGSGLSFLDPESISDQLTEIDQITIFSLLKEYVSFVFRRRSMMGIASIEALNEILKKSGSVFLCYNPKTKKISYISSSIKYLLGFKEEKIRNMSPDDIITLIHPDEREMVMKNISRINLNRPENFPDKLEFSIQDVKSNYHIMQLHTTFDRDADKNGSYFCIAQDITKIRETEQMLLSANQRLEKAENDMVATSNELAQLNSKLEKHYEELEVTNDRLSASEEMFRQLAESTDDVFWLRNDKEFLYINDQFEKIWGRSKKEIIENPYKLTEWIHPDDLSNIEPWVNLETLVKGEPYIEQYRIIKPDGKIRWIGSKVFPVFDRDNKPYRLVGIASDITEQKDFEETLRIAKEKAQESDMLKSTFLANISHEIRTPMNGIVGFAELLGRNDVDSQARKNYIAIMKKSSEQLICIIDDIIDFAKLEANQIRIIEEKIDLNKMFEELQIFYDNQLVKQGITAVTLLHENTLEDVKAKIISDEHRLRQVLSYLLDNAIKYTSEGFIKFGYKLVNEKIEFYVQDTGIGIQADKHQHIFERFRQADEGHTRRYGGTGLGLPISKGLVNLLGGQIWLKSEPEKGSTFYFTVPYRLEHITEPAGKIVIDESEKYNWKNKLILVAEDDELNFEYIKVILEPTEAKIIRAKDGSQAVKICSNLNFDLILMDIRLPVMNGIQATKQLREMGVLTPIIAQTAFAMDDDEQRCLSAGCNRYIAKPISKEKLYYLINELI